MRLQVRGRHVVRHLAFDRAAHDRSLVLASRDQRDLPCAQDGRHAHRQRLARHVLLPKEIRRGVPPRHHVQRHEPRGGVFGRAGLVEPDVPTAPDAQDLEIDAAGLRDRPLVGGAVLGNLLARHGAVGDVDVLRTDVHVVEQVLPHVAPVAMGAVGCHRVVLVEVERHDLGEAHLALLVPRDQLAIDAQRRAAGGEPQHAAPLGRHLAVNHLDDALRDQRGQLVVLGHDDRAQALGGM